MHGIFNAGAFELGHHNRDAVDEQYRIGDDMPAAACQFHLELVDHQKIVVLGMVEVDIADRLRPAVVPIRQAIDHGSLEQELRRGLIDLHQSMTGGTLQIPD